MEGPSDSFETGVEMEERRLIWKIKNFPVVLQHESMINSQQIEFYAGEAIGLASKWRVFLRSKEVNGKKWAGIFVSLIERPALQSEFVFAKCAFKTCNSQGGIMRNLATEVKDMLSPVSKGWGFAEFADVDQFVKSTEENCTIRITFKLYSPSIIAAKSVNDLVEEFKKVSEARLRQDLQHLRISYRDCTDIKIVSSDKKQIGMKKEIIAARSPVFKAMLESDMAEANSGMIHLPDVKSQALSVLRGYLCLGELRADWKKSEILVELTYAAAKYQLAELLSFLDSVLGRVCDLDNVVALVSLANKLSLKTAEQDLLRFVRMKGSRSTDDFLQALNNAFDMTPYSNLVLDNGGGEKDKASETGSGAAPGSTTEKMDDGNGKP